MPWDSPAGGDIAVQRLYLSRRPAAARSALPGRRQARRGGRRHQPGRLRLEGGVIAPRPPRWPAPAPRRAAASRARTRRGRGARSPTPASRVACGTGSGTGSACRRRRARTPTRRRSLDEPRALRHLHRGQARWRERDVFGLHADAALGHAPRAHADRRPSGAAEQLGPRQERIPGQAASVVLRQREHRLGARLDARGVLEFHRAAGGAGATASNSGGPTTIARRWASTSRTRSATTSGMRRRDVLALAGIRGQVEEQRRGVLAPLAELRVGAAGDEVRLVAALAHGAQLVVPVVEERAVAGSGRCRSAARADRRRRSADRQARRGAGQPGRGDEHVHRRADVGDDGRASPCPATRRSPACARRLPTSSPCRWRADRPSRHAPRTAATARCRW